MASASSPLPTKQPQEEEGRGGGEAEDAHDIQAPMNPVQEERECHTNEEGGEVEDPLALIQRQVDHAMEDKRVLHAWRMMNDPLASEEEEEEEEEEGGGGGGRIRIRRRCSSEGRAGVHQAAAALRAARGNRSRIQVVSGEELKEHFPAPTRDETDVIPQRRYKRLLRRLPEHAMNAMNTTGRAAVNMNSVEARARMSMKKKRDTARKENGSSNGSRSNVSHHHHHPGLRSSLNDDDDDDDDGDDGGRQRGDAKRKKVEKKKKQKKKQGTQVKREEPSEEADVGDAVVIVSDSDGEEEEEEEGEEEEDDGLRLPSSIRSRLFDYQVTAIRWMLELHESGVGGIVGDEMGLGKTVQVVAFFAALYERKDFQPSLIVCPATVMTHWRDTLRTWWPRAYVRILHNSSVGTSSTTTSMASEDASGAIVREILERRHGDDAGVLITTYETLKRRRQSILSVRWGYAVLDEGHRIRNPDAETTLVCKQLQTCRRLLLTGSPIQNRLSELWSLFDFCYPGRLGTLPVFEAEFALPIQMGSYASASPLQVHTARRCAAALRDVIAPYILRRLKRDVMCSAALPPKTEQILFVSLTQPQLRAYRQYISGKEVREILLRERNALCGIDTLRKLCNHPDLLEREEAVHLPTYGAPARSGKLTVALQVLASWRKEGHRCLVFTQTQQMLDIIESAMLRVQPSMVYTRMDGSTPISRRNALIDDYNREGSSVFAFLLTTRVGGIGVNLTGADRVLLFDPDWNPSTDAQARERAWRVGQSRPVTVYRLITSGTIEEKIYHRQVFKQSVSDKVMTRQTRSAQQAQRYFNHRDLHDLFSLGHEYAAGEGTETAEIFEDVPAHIDVEAEARDASADADGGGGGNDAQAETSLLQKLFDETGVHSAMDHDAIMGASAPAQRTMHEEARRVADAAVTALRKSREALRSARLGIATPTWTGQNGVAGRPRFGQQRAPLDASAIAQHSSSLLAKIRSRAAVTDEHRNLSTEAAPVVAVDGTGASSSSIDAPEAALLDKLHSFLSSRPGHSAPSSILIRHFSKEVDSGRAAIFKQFLKSIAHLAPASCPANAGAAADDTKEWTLRPEFI